VTSSLEQLLAADPWARATSKNGIPCDELISALQKAIRRGSTENALMVAREMFVSGAALRAHLWQRLQIIGCEDVGDGSFAEPVVLDALHRTYERARTESEGDSWVLVVHAVRFLAERAKDRTTSELAALVAHWHEQGQPVEIPDAAVDMHTARGRAMGRGLAHYAREGAHVTREREGRDRSYYEQWLRLFDGP
jgi:replication-associated recombination protein RarA